MVINYYTKGWVVGMDLTIHIGMAHTTFECVVDLPDGEREIKHQSILANRHLTGLGFLHDADPQGTPHNELETVAFVNMMDAVRSGKKDLAYCLKCGHVDRLQEWYVGHSRERYNSTGRFHSSKCPCCQFWDTHIDPDKHAMRFVSITEDE